MAGGRHEYLGIETSHGVGYPSLSIQRGCWLLIMFLSAPLQRAFSIFFKMSSANIKLALLQIARKQKIARL